MKRSTALLTSTAVATLAAGVVATGPPARAGWPAGAPDRREIVAAALDALREHAGAVGFTADRVGPQGLGRGYRVNVTDVMVDPGGATHVRMERSYAGLPVRGGDFVEHLGADGHWLGASSTF